ncbi:hypothetical protein B0J18DRAFT_364919 [Chaetomium sp. MPI-SDFR-AT-0129]|nr:hypothetical protein B0J18DRAFT_364919 [Chaetomium sp. MPI-SDFR-AT-0129]
MEFLSGYAAAKAPYITYEVDGLLHSQTRKPTRSNSASAKSNSKKRSRIPGHARTNSASTSSSGGGRTERPALPLGAEPHPGVPWLPQHQGQLPSEEEGGDALATSALSDGGDSATEAANYDNHYPHPPLSPRSLKTRRHSTRERDRMPPAFKYFQDKQLPATPRLNTADSHTKTAGAGAGSHSEPASARTPASATAATAGHTFGNPGAVVAAVTFPERRIPLGSMLSHVDTGMGTATAATRVPGGGGGARAESISSVSGTTISNRTVNSSDHGSGPQSAARPFIMHNGRAFLADPTLPYPLPVDLEELHRQSLKTMLLMQLYGRPICAPAFANKPPPRILEIGCGTGFWSMMCHKHYEARGLHKDMSFTGIDIARLPASASSSNEAPTPTITDTRPDKSMNWRFVQHDLRRLPLPFPDASFDFIMVKDMALVTTLSMQQALVEEYIRLLVPGGTIEVWETDNVLRMLRPHIPDFTTTSGGPTDGNPIGDDGNNATPTTTTTSASQDTETTSTNPEADIGGAYLMTPNTPLSTPLNNFLVEYNAWASRALEARALCAMPCTVIGSMLVQESEVLTGIGSRRWAVPLSEIRWEKEGVGGVVTKDGKSYIETKGKGRRAGSSSGGGVGLGIGSGRDTSGGGSERRGLEPAAAALRRTALMTVVGMIQSMEPMLREANGKSQDEWDTWVGKMMNDLVRDNGTSWGECLEVGAWWARKK